MSPLPVDVVIPVYKGYEETRRCIESVLASPPKTTYELVLVDDAGPEARLTAYLDELASQHAATLLRNDENLGFVRSVNRGISLHPDRDVVLLNSDTEVANDWLDRLRACAYRDDGIATVTPFTNNGTICSYPYEGWPGGVPGTLGLAALDRLVSLTNVGLSMELPTAVGFCMYIRRACLDRVGSFDAERFGLGYGEENDFSRRAAEAGWRNLLAADVFVFHEGGVSFSERTEKLKKTAIAAMLEAHPDYLDRVRDFIARDPVAPLRAAVDRARGWRGPEESRCLLEEREGRLGRRERNRPVRLHVGHSWGGGTERWMHDFRKGDEGHRNLVLRSRSERNFSGWRLELLEPELTDIPIMGWNLADPIRATDVEHSEYRTILNGIVDIFGVQAILVSSLVGHAMTVLGTELSTVVVLHDLYPFCPAMFAYFDEPCVECSAGRLQECLNHNALNEFWHNTVPDDWFGLRDAYARHMARENIRLVAPTESVRGRLVALLPALAHKPWVRIPHGLDADAVGAGVRCPVRDSGGRLRVVVPGRLLPHKGLHLLRAVLPLLDDAEVLLLGCGDFGQVFASMPNVKIVPHYDLAELGARITDFAPDCALLPSILPESYSYTLSEMFALGVPVVATRTGAFAERIEHGVDGLLCDPTLDGISSALKKLIADRTALAWIRENLADRPVPGLAEMVRQYQHLLPPAVERPASVAEQGLIEAVGRQGDLEREIAWFRGEYHRNSERIQARREEVFRMQDQLDRLGRQVADLTAERERLLHSTSWRITAPIRALKRTWLRLAGALPAGREGSGAPEMQPAVAGPDWQDRGGQLRELVTETAHERGDARRWLRHNLGVPDKSRILLVCGEPSGPESAIRFEKIAQACQATHNDAHFVLLDSTADASCWKGVKESLLVLSSLRKLFFYKQTARREDCLMATDVLLMFGRGLKDDSISNFASSYGIPIMDIEAVATDGSSLEDVAQLLSDWLGKVA